MEKRRFNLIILIALLFLVTIIGCSKVEEKANQFPICNITDPLNGQVIEKGDTVMILIESSDINGYIREVVFYVDGIKYGSAVNSPYIFNWITNSMNVGFHTLKAISIDNENDTSFNEISVVINISYGFVDPRDEKTYKLVDIGSQTWFAENLNYETHNSWWFDNNSSNGNIYGRLYTWRAALTACPSGWHLPSDNEWKSLEMQLGMSQSEADDHGYRGTLEGARMKTTNGWHSNANGTNGNGTNSSNFSALPGGCRYPNEQFYWVEYDGYWWSATESNTQTAWYRALFSSHDDVWRDTDTKSIGFSVRCLKD